MIRKMLVPDYDYIKNMSENQLIELAYINDGIPSRIMMYVMTVFPDFKRARKYASWDHEEFVDMDIAERRKTLKMEIFAAQRYKEQNAINFLKRYPQFKGIAKGIQYWDTNIEKVIKTEPFD